MLGSLNPLSHTAKTSEVMARVESRALALQMQSLLSINQGNSKEGEENTLVKAENPR